MGIIRIAKSCGRFAINSVRRCKELINNAIQMGGGKEMPSYFPECAPLYGRWHEFCYQSKNILKYGYPNRFYKLYGLDVKNKKDKDTYVDYTLFMNQRNCMNFKSRFSQVVILRDKSLFGLIAKEFGICTPENIGLISSGNIYLFTRKHEMPVEEYIRTASFDAFLKPIDGECGEGVVHLENNGGSLLINGQKLEIGEFLKKVRKGKYLLQEKIIDQHDSIKKIYPSSINTIRLVTVKDPKTGDIIPLSAVLRVGANGNIIDNWAAGGLSIGIDIESSRLKKYGFYKPGFGTKTAEHPDTGVTFENYEIPYFKEAVEMALEFHRRLTGIHSVGWDIAITENGPCIIEGNDNWEISLMQICNKGYAEEFKRLFY